MPSRNHHPTGIIAATAIVCLMLMPLPRAMAQNPFGGGGAAAPAAPDVSELIGEQDPLVLAIQESNPQTPAELLKATKMLMDYGRADSARGYAAKLIAANPAPKTLAALVGEYGTGFFMTLQRNKAMAPEGPSLSLLALDGAYKYARDPANIATAIEGLSSPSEGIRVQAMKDLQAGGDAAVAILINHLADPAKADKKSFAGQALISLGAGVVEEPLIATLEAPDDTLRAEVAFILGKVQSKRAIEFLAGPAVDEKEAAQVRQRHHAALVSILGVAPTTEQSKEFLRKRVESFLDGEPPRVVSFDDEIVLWKWNQEKLTPEPRTMLAADASLVTASQLARRLYEIDSQSAESQQTYLLALLEAEKSVNGYGVPLASGAQTARQNAEKLGAPAVERTLMSAMKSDRIAAAIGAAEVLGGMKDVDVLHGGGAVRPLVKALRHGDRRVRFAAVQSIMQQDPHRSFPGASYLIDALRYFVATYGERRALVGHPRVSRAQDIVAYLRSTNIQALSATTGHRVFKAAAAQPDMEFVMISDRINHPRASELVQMLRKDPRTSRLPVALMAAGPNLPLLRSQFDSDPLTLVGPQPVEIRAALRTTQKLIQLPGRRYIPVEERLLQARACIKHLTHMLRNQENYPFFDMLRVEKALELAFRTPEFTDDVAEAMGLLATPLTQLALVEVASENARPVKDRQAAAKAFDVAVKRRGLLLRIPDIKLQYQRYNESATLDVETQAVLGSVLDAIEYPTKKKKD